MQLPSMKLISTVLVTATLALPATVTAQVPTIREELSLSSVRQPRMNPMGGTIAYTVRTPNWETDGWTSQLFFVGADGESRAVTNESHGFSGGGGWTPDGGWYAFRSSDNGSAVLRLISRDGTDERTVPLPSGVRRYQFSPDGSTIAFTRSDQVSDRAQRERELFGQFNVKGESFQRVHLWTVPFEDEGQAVRLTAGEFSVGSFAWSPDGSRIAFSHAPTPLSNDSYYSDVSVVDVADKRIRVLVDQIGTDRSPIWSPDGEWILFTSTMDREVTNLPADLVTISAEGGELHVVTDEFETEPRAVAWNEAGVWFTAYEGVERFLYRVDSNSGEIVRVSDSPLLMAAVSMTADGSALAFTAGTSSLFREVYRSSTARFVPEKLTDMTAQVNGWSLGTREVVSWPSTDGLTIEGILHKPSDFREGERYPLLVVVHGGPRAVSTPELRLTSAAYPISQWLNRGALVLQPNYRGSVGYGGDFRARHHRDLGSGDATDVLRGVDYLIDQGLVDPARVGVMGWSYGGFISAFLTATSDRFAAISVGAGIADWRTHYAWEPANITTRVFSFGATPWENDEVYRVASPVTYIGNASTPTLIQHVDGDPIVTVLSAYELWQGLLDNDVTVRFVEYPGRGHFVSGLKQLHGALWHNLEWFGRYIWGDEVELPE